MKYGKRVWPTETTSAVCLILWFFYFCLFSNSFALSALMESASLEFIPSCSSSMNFFIFILISISSLIWHIPNLMNSCLTFLFHAFKAQMMSAGHLYSCSGEALSSRLCCLHVQDTRTQAVVHRVPLVWFCTEQVEGKDFLRSYNKSLRELSSCYYDQITSSPLSNQKGFIWYFSLSCKSRCVPKISLCFTQWSSTCYWARHILWDAYPQFTVGFLFSPLGYTPNDMPVKAKRSTYNYSLPITVKKPGMSCQLEGCLTLLFLCFTPSYPQVVRSVSCAPAEPKLELRSFLWPIDYRVTSPKDQPCMLSCWVDLLFAEQPRWINTGRQQYNATVNLFPIRSLLPFSKSYSQCTRSEAGTWYSWCIWCKKASLQQV